MAINAINPKKSWSFQFSGLVRNEMPLKLEQDQSAVLFTVVLNDKETVKFRFETFREQGQVVEGTYTILPTGYSGTTVLKVEEAGSKLQGYFKGDLSRLTFKIQAK